MDLRIAHDRMGSSADPSLNGHLKYPNNLDQSLNDPTPDKIRKYRADYNNRSPSVVSFMTAIPSTSDRLHSEFVRILFLQTHRETDRFFAVSGVPETAKLLKLQKSGPMIPNDSLSSPSRERKSTVPCSPTTLCLSHAPQRLSVFPFSGEEVDCPCIRERFRVWSLSQLLHDFSSPDLRV